MTDTESHVYTPGWMPYDIDLVTWYYVKEEMSAWRFCPVCGNRLLSSTESITYEPRCSTCHRPIEACPCGCVAEHDE